MAQNKSEADILKSVKYMDDAVDSVLFNLTKAAKRKNEYIWAPQKFNSLDSIWGDPIELESDQVLEASKMSKNPKCESKILKPQYCDESNLVEVIVPDNAQKTGLHHDQTLKVAASRKEQPYCGIGNKQITRQVHECNPVEVIMSDDALKTGLQPELSPKVSASRKAPLLQNFGESNEGKGNKFKYSNPANKILNANEQYNDNRVKRKNLSRNPGVGCRISDTRYEWSQEISQRKHNFRAISTLQTENHSQYNFSDAEKISKLTFENCKPNVASNGEENVKSHNGVIEFQSSRIETKLNYSDKSQKERTVERIKRKRHLSSSVNSLLPEQKHISIENQKHETDDKRSIMLTTMLELKIFKGDKVFDFTIKLPDFNRMKKRFPKLEEVLPETDGDQKELNYSADAVKIVLGFLRNLRYPTPDDERTAIEVLAASKSWEMYQFHDEFKQKFSEKLNRNNVSLAYGAAVHYGLMEICDAYKCILSDDFVNRPYRPRKCYIAVSTYIEPREFCFPSKISTSTLNDNFDRDIKNEIIFKAMTGSYVITGFHILLDVDNENETDSINLEFFYVVRNVKSAYEEQFNVRKPLRRNIVIHLKKSLVVHRDETAEIVVESSIKPYLCFAIQENNFVGRCDESKFSLNVTSNYKVNNSNEKRFLIGKLLYYPKT